MIVVFGDTAKARVDETLMVLLSRSEYFQAVASFLFSMALKHGGVMRFLSILTLFLIFGCVARNADVKPVSYVEPEEMGEVAGTGIESQDVVKVTNQMAASLTEVLGTRGIPQDRRPTVAVLPIDNETRFDINTKLLLTRIRVLLSKKMSGRVSFLARERMDQLYEEHKKKKTGMVTDDGKDFAPKGVDLFLTGELMSITTKTQSGHSDYVLYTFRIIDSATSEELWTDMVELKKEGREDAAYL